MARVKPSQQTIQALKKYYAGCLANLVKAAERYPDECDIDTLLMGKGLNKKEKLLIIKHVRNRSRGS